MVDGSIFKTSEELISFSVTTSTIATGVDGFNGSIIGDDVTTELDITIGFAVELKEAASISGNDFDDVTNSLTEDDVATESDIIIGSVVDLKWIDST